MAMKHWEPLDNTDQQSNVGHNFPTIRPVRVSTDECKMHQLGHGASDKYISEHRAQYNWKPSDPLLLRNPTLHCRSVHYMKPYEESKLRHDPLPLAVTESVTNSDFRWEPKPFVKPMPNMHLPSAVETSKMLLDQSKAGFAKYLDTSATTSNLAYVAYSPEQILGIGAKDNITFWNWNEVGGLAAQTPRPPRDNELCSKKKNRVYRSTTKIVPHSGMTTEVRENFRPLPAKTLDFDISTMVGNELTTFPTIPFPKHTENNIYGSGDRLQKYLNIEAP